MKHVVTMSWMSLSICHKKKKKKMIRNTHNCFWTPITSFTQDVSKSQASFLGRTGPQKWGPPETRRDSFPAFTQKHNGTSRRAFSVGLLTAFRCIITAFWTGIWIYLAWTVFPKNCWRIWKAEVYWDFTSDPWCQRWVRITQAFTRSICSDANMHPLQCLFVGPLPCCVVQPEKGFSCGRHFVNKD